jgi:hypothetical protein
MKNIKLVFLLIGHNIIYYISYIFYNLAMRMTYTDKMFGKILWAMSTIIFLSLLIVNTKYLINNIKKFKLNQNIK